MYVPLLYYMPSIRGNNMHNILLAKMLESEHLSTKKLVVNHRQITSSTESYMSMICIIFFKFNL